jgi:hypothetical protein
MTIDDVRTDLWLKIAGVTFGLWSLAVPVGVALVRSSVADIASSQLTLANKLQDYVLANERRITTLENRQSEVRADIVELKQMMESERMARILGSRSPVLPHLQQREPK